jgi:processive 1,2-diacylglycerol beta-glucosyltransferase
MSGPKILLLTANYGNGHLQVAHSLKEEFISHSDTTIIMKDLFYETSPLIHEWTKKIYLKSYTKSGRQIYRLFYYSSKQISKRKNFNILSYGYSKLCKIVEEEQPDLIINTFPSFAVPFHRKKMNSAIPTYNVITDYCLHHSWVHPNIDKYYVASAKLQSDLQQLGIHNKNIILSGMPIHNDFEKQMNIQDVYQKYELCPSLKTVLIVAGAYGVSKEMKEICYLLEDDPLLQLVIVCGKNDDLYKNLRQTYSNNQNVRVLGYVTEMAKLLKVANCVITKPGGIILSEAMATNTPILLPKATPGQESENARFFHNEGAAVWNEKAEQLALQTKQLVRDEAKLNKMKRSLANLHFPNATRTVANDILADYDQRRFTYQMLKG